MQLLSQKEAVEELLGLRPPPKRVRPCLAIFSSILLPYDVLEAVKPSPHRTAGQDFGKFGNVTCSLLWRVIGPHVSSTCQRYRTSQGPDHILEGSPRADPYIIPIIM